MFNTYRCIVSGCLLLMAALIVGVPGASAFVGKPATQQIKLIQDRSSLLVEVRGRGKRAHRRKRPGRPPNFNRPNNRHHYKKRARRRFWGRVVGGVVLGTTIAVAAGRAPAPPSPGLCWNWSNNGRTQGYWYYCNEPY